MTTDYSYAVVFSKHTNLLPWFECKYHDKLSTCATSVGFNQLKHNYSRDRDVQLILLVRYDDNGHTYCKIKCPINPLPIKGEFEVVSLKQLINLLEIDYGWTIKQKLPTSLLK